MMRKEIRNLLLMNAVMIMSLLGHEVYYQEDFETIEVLGWQTAGRIESVAVAGNWHRMVAKFNSGKNIRLIVEIATTQGSIGSMWVDNFTSSPDVPVSNPGFENGLTDWIFKEAYLDQKVFSQGKKSIRMTHLLESSPTVMIHRKFEVRPDTEYDFAVDMLVGDDFQGECRFLIYDEQWHCIMSNYGEPFASTLVGYRDRNDHRVIAMEAEPGKPAGLTRSIELPSADTNVCFSLDCCVKEGDGSFTAMLKDPVSGKEQLRLIPDARKEGWQTLAGIAVAGAKTLELSLKVEGKDTVQVDNITITPPRLIPEPQIAKWYGAKENFVLSSETLTVAITGANERDALTGALELLSKDLGKFGRKVLRTDREDAALQIIIDPKYAVFQNPKEGYYLNVKAHEIRVESGTERGAFYGVMTLLGLLGRYGEAYGFPCVGMTDYPNLSFRGYFHSISPEQCARMKLNAYLVSTGYPESPADIANVNRVLAECRKFYIEPIAYICTVPQGYYVNGKNPSLAAGKHFANEPVTLRGSDSSILEHPYVIRTQMTDIVVKNAAGTCTYEEGKDYTVIAGDMTFPFDKADSAQRFAIARTDKSGIINGGTVSVSYDAIPVKYPAYCPLEPQVRQFNDAFFFKYMEQFQFKYVHTILCLMEFTQTCENKMAQDSRITRSGQSVLEICMKDLLANVDAMKQVNPDVKVLFFTGEVNDFVKQAAPILKARADNLLAVIWGYDASWPAVYGVEAVKFWSANGISSVMMPWRNKRNIQGHAQLAYQAVKCDYPCIGLFGSSWSEGDGDPVETAAMAWRIPRRGEKSFMEFNNLDPEGWETMQPKWEDIQIPAPGGKTLLAQRLMFEAPKSKILAVPVLTYMPDKNLLMLSFNSGYAEGNLVHYAMKMYSSDGGKTWTSPVYFNETGEALGINSMTCYLGGGKLLAYPAVLETKHRYLSTDYGRSWKKYSRVFVPQENDLFGCWDAPLVTEDKIYETGYFYGVSQRENSRAYYRVSEDGGKTFEPDIIPIQWNGANEVYLFRKHDGGFVAVMRKQNIHSETDQGDFMAVSLSTDGLNWSDPIDIQPAGRMHPSIVELEDHRLILTYVVREGYPDSPEGFPRFGIEAVESLDGGKTWYTAEPYKLVQFTAEKLNGKDRWAASTQSTSSVLMPDGNILTVFGTAHRATFGAGHQQMPRDIGIISWKP